MVDIKAIKTRHTAGMDSRQSAHQDREDLLAEVERLQHDIADLQMLRDEHQMDVMHAFQEGGEEERRKTVAWLREHADAEHPVERGEPALSPAARGLLLLHADHIERGEHCHKENT